jgi:hypothetical protein
LGRALLRVAEACAIALALLAVVDFALYRRWVAGLRRDDLPAWPPPAGKRVPLAVWKRVGFLANEKRSSFLAHPVAKPAGTIRICAFGDSFTHGDEVDRDYDYPTLLGALLAEDPSRRTEVLNFGASWFGFHQTYLLWEGHGRDYACDDVLLGPATFFPERDTSFQHAGLGEAYYLHARYVRDDGGVNLVEVEGDTLEERFEGYFGFLPRLAYLRYDAEPPAFLRALLPPGRTIDNPFYYEDAADVRKEAADTYAVLLERMAASGARLLLATAGPAPQIAPELSSPRLQRVVFPDPGGFPYRAPRNHFGPLGNHLVASHFRRALTGEAPLPELRASAPPSAATAAAGAKPLAPGPPLSAYDAIWLELAGVPIAYFATGERISSRVGSPLLLREAGTASLLQVGRSPSSEKETAAWSLEGCWAALDRPLVAGEEVVLRIAGEERPLGRVELVADGVNAGRIARDDSTPLVVDQGGFLEPNALAVANAGTRAADGAVAAILVGPTRIASGRVAGGGVSLDLERGACWRPRADEAGFVDVRSLPAAGVFDLVLQRGGSVRRIPVAGWEKVTVAAAGRTQSSLGVGSFTRPPRGAGPLALAAAN